MTISQQLSTLLDAGMQLLPTERLPAFAVDGQTPRAVVQPANRQEVAQVLQWASGHGLSVFPRGGGTQLALGNVPSRVDLVLDLSRYHRVLDYQPADLTATVEAGISLAALQRELAPGGKFLPLEAPLAERATIGGILAANASGPLRYGYGLPRDWLIGISVVTADGVEAKAGGKVVKNVTGYDLNKLYIGSLGTLGVIVEATFKLAPCPAALVALAAGFSSLREGAEAGASLLRQVFAPQGVQVINREAARRSLPAIWGETPEGAAAPFPGLDTHAGNGSTTGNPALALAFFSGPGGRSLRRRLEEAERLFRGMGARDLAVLEELEARPALDQLTDLGWREDTAPYLGIKVTVPPSAVARLAQGFDEAEAAGRHDPHTLGLPLGLPAVAADPGSGAIRTLWWAGPEGEATDSSAVLQTIGRIRELARGAGGFAVVERCPLAAKKEIDVWGGPPQGIKIMRRIKQQFDPLGVLNPGRFVDRI
jgi:glycolate oxidase FAD binding subunit